MPNETEPPVSYVFIVARNRPEILARVTERLCIVDAHGGRRRASNNVGGGATFQLTLPIDAERTR